MLVLVTVTDGSTPSVPQLRERTSSPASLCPRVRSLRTALVFALPPSAELKCLPTRPCVPTAWLWVSDPSTEPLPRPPAQLLLASVLVYSCLNTRAATWWHFTVFNEQLLRLYASMTYVWPHQRSFSYVFMIIVSPTYNQWQHVSKRKFFKESTNILLVLRFLPKYYSGCLPRVRNESLTNDPASCTIMLERDMSWCTILNVRFFGKIWDISNHFFQYFRAYYSAATHKESKYGPWDPFRLNET